MAVVSPCAATSKGLKKSKVIFDALPLSVVIYFLPPTMVVPGILLTALVIN